MWRRLRLVPAALALAALAVVGTPGEALADGGTAIGIPSWTATNPYGASYTCSGSGFASWSGSGYTEITFGGSTSCSGDLVMRGQAELILNGGSAPVATASFEPPFATTYGSAVNYYTAPQGSVLFIRYTTTVQARPNYTWTTVPPHCTVDGPSITCSAIRPFTAD